MTTKLVFVFPLELLIKVFK